MKINNPNTKIFPEDFFSQPFNQHQAVTNSTVSQALNESRKNKNHLKLKTAHKNILEKEQKSDTVGKENNLNSASISTSSTTYKKIRKVPSFREVLKIEAIPEEDEEKMKTATTNFLRQSKNFEKNNIHKKINFHSNEKNGNTSESKLIFEKFNTGNYNQNLEYESKIISSFSNLQDEEEGIGLDYFDDLEKLNFTPTPNRDKSSESNIMINEASTSGSYRAPIKKKIFNFENLNNVDLLNSHLNIPTVHDHLKQTACFSPLPSVRKEKDKEMEIYNYKSENPQLFNEVSCSYSTSTKEINISDNNINDISEITPIPCRIKLNHNKKDKNLNDNLNNNPNSTPISIPVQVNKKENLESKFKLNRHPSISKLNSQNKKNITATATGCAASTGTLKISNFDKKISNSPSFSKNKNDVNLKNSKYTERAKFLEISPLKNKPTSLSNKNYNQETIQHDIHNNSQFNTITTSNSSSNMLPTTSRFLTPKNDVFLSKKINFCNSNKNVNNFNKKFSNNHVDSTSSVTTANSNSYISIASASPVPSPLISNNQITTTLPHLVSSILPPLTSRGEPKKIQFELKNIFSAAQNFKEDPEVKGKIDDLMKNIFDIKNVLQEKSKNRAGLTSAPTERKVLSDFSRKGTEIAMTQRGERKEKNDRSERSESKNNRIASCINPRNHSNSGSKTKRNSIK